MFVVSLVLSVTFGLLWAYAETTGHARSSYILLGLFLIVTTFLFGSIPWSKFSHMFFKPAAALEKRVAEANGTMSNLPPPADAPRKYGGGLDHARHYRALSIDCHQEIGTEHADLRVHDPLRQLRTLCRYMPVRHHAHRHHLPARGQYRAEYVLGVLFLRKGVSAVCDRLSRLRGFRPARP